MFDTTANFHRIANFQCFLNHYIVVNVFTDSHAQVSKSKMIQRRWNLYSSMDKPNHVQMTNTVQLRVLLDDSCNYTRPALSEKDVW